MRCNNCGAENPNRRKVCNFCGEKMESKKKKNNQISCSGCGQLVAIKYQYCPYCGSDNSKAYAHIHVETKTKRPLGQRIVIGLSISVLVMFVLSAFALVKYVWHSVEVDEQVQAKPAKQVTEQAPNQASDEDIAAQNEDAVESWAETVYEAGDYTVGKDIPAGMYVLFVNSDRTFGTCGFYNVPDPDLLGERRYRSDFDFFDVVYLKSGDHIRTVRCTLEPFEMYDWDVDDFFTYSDGTYYGGGYVVGQTLPAGTYVVSSVYEEGSDAEASLKIWDSIHQRRLELRKEASPSETYYDIADKNEKVTLTDGQYILGEGIYLIPEVLAEDLIVS